MDIMLIRIMYVCVKYVIYIVLKGVCIDIFKISVFFYLIIYLWVFSLFLDLEGGCNFYLKWEREREIGDVV